MPEIIITEDDRIKLKALIREIAPGRRSFSIETVREAMHRKSITRMIQKKVFTVHPEDRTVLILNPDVLKTFERS